MIRYFHHNEIERKHWDECVSGADNRLVYALSWYLDIVSPDWEALILDDYRAVMPLTWKKKFGVKYLVQPPFCQQLGVFGKYDDCRNADPFMNEIPGKFKNKRIHFNRDNSIQIQGIKIIERTNFELRLDADFNTLFDNYSTIHKKNIKTGRNRKISVDRSSDIRQFYDFVMQNHREKFTINDRSARILQQILDVSADKDSFELYFALSEERKIIAAIYLLRSFERYILLLTPSTEFGSRNRAVYLLIDHFIRIHSNRHEILDFEGSSIEGIAKFFKGFGATATKFIYMKDNRIFYRK
jgi:hypothetical protein